MADAESMRFCVLASGSKGNALWVEAQGQALMVDAGLSGRELLKRISLAGLDSKRLRAIVVTHEHRDHVSGAGILARKLKIPVHINPATLAQAQSLMGPADFRPFDTGRAFRLGSVRLHPFSISHDTADPVGFIFECHGKRLGLATDLGVATGLVKTHLAGVNALILEANHDPDMLMNGPYPWPTKQRVRSRQGHLSNEDAGELLAVLAHKDLAHVVLAHLSETNNQPLMALEQAKAALGSRTATCSLTAASQVRPGAVIVL